MKTAVLFDLGNVLVRLDLARGLRRFQALVQGGPASLEEASLFFCEPSLACNLGTLDGEAFLDAMAERLRLGADRRSELRDAWCDIFTPWPEMELLASDVLAAGHPAYLLSNTDPIHFAWLSARMPVLGQLTGLHLSYEAGLMKPDPAYFIAALDRFGLAAGECAFVDDRPEHVEAARSVGISAILHRGDVAEVRAFLRGRGVPV